MKCRACGCDHSPLLTCGRAARMRLTANPIAINTPEPINTPAINEAMPAKSANGRKREDYNAYMRDYMRKRRAH